MATWQQFSEEAPALAEKIKERFTAAKSHVLATVRRDGSPRVSGSEVDFREQDLLIGSMIGAMKAKDLQHDGRFAIHAASAIDEGGADAKVSGKAVEITDPAEVARLQGDDGEAHVFRLDLTEAVLTWVEGNTIYFDFWKEGQGLKRLARPDNGPVVEVARDQG
ncbi:pyridoxamine 5'-phosphate oxidase [Amycolatopsis sp. MJM2582]|uniref:pyridoxamine 5'-phosphate oxidase family protein n=1 Tax=Amycolatopsis TaxID=1813 RepID=UPI000504004D|nr:MULTISPECIES: pyridoxamine 5'-phosphate oxidase family protein [unclassified Amycolatopsis]KFZ78415.1 pyridoxamine 5'-phosphate oxidase [Amycolatopsis sp. MJM2582]RSN41412.1 pyridoxamine 5'-phosphate oxidase family protein [Amycolatopsis sp. WAC 04197]